MAIKNDKELIIYFAKTRKVNRLTKKNIRYSEFLSFLENTKRTYETREEYENFSKIQKSNIKDVGGFVAGRLSNGIRRKSCVIDRSIITLDADFCSSDFLEKVDKTLNCAYIIYSTHSHKKGDERYRLLIPLSTSINGDEYEVLGRFIAKEIDDKSFDKTTFDSSKLMYFPSTSKDGEYFFYFKDEKFLNPLEVLEKISLNKSKDVFSDLKDESLKEENSNEENNYTKKRSGLIGAFLNTYNIHKAIDKFLSDVYSKFSEDRYTYKKGTTVGGAVVYKDGEFIYSNHSSDKATGKLLNSFDLVRIHKFGQLDEGVETEKESKKPSFLAMMDFCKMDKNLLKLSLLNSAELDFKEEDKNWLGLLKINKKGEIVDTIKNITLIIQNDSKLKNKIGFDEFTNSIFILEKLPWYKKDFKPHEWGENDDNNLISYIEEFYNISNGVKILQALSIASDENRFHPIINYLEKRKWDGIKRLDTLFIDYLGSEDNSYIREVTRKIFVGAVARVYEPGIKFDNMLILIGNQGIGKSRILEILGGEWYSDSIITLQGKEAFEQLQNTWIGEISELSAFKKAEVELVKHFISKCVDNYRPAYGRRVLKIKRQCVFFGTTNKKNFLKDETGNRRFWPVEVTGKGKKSIWNDLTKDEVLNIWSEAVYYYKRGESLFINGKVENEAKNIQLIHSDRKVLKGLIEDYLEIILPSYWYKLDINERIKYLEGVENGEEESISKGIKRDKISLLEIWIEVFKRDKESYTRSDANNILKILREVESFEEYKNNSGRLKIDNIYGVQKSFIRKSFF